MGFKIYNSPGKTLQTGDKTDGDNKLLSLSLFHSPPSDIVGICTVELQKGGEGEGCLCRYFGQNISQLKCSAGQRDVREIKTNI